MRYINRFQTINRLNFNIKYTKLYVDTLNINLILHWSKTDQIKTHLLKFIKNSINTDLKKNTNKNV